MTDTTSNNDGGDGPMACAFDGSQVVRTLRAQFRDDGSLARALENSRVARTLRAPFRDDSRTNRATRWLSTAVRNSFIYRWLTTEPEPEVVVIDLRETWTVGPVVRLLDRLVDRVTPYWRESTLKRELDGVVVLGERAADTKYGQLVVKLLEPPKPPEDATDSDERVDTQSIGLPDENEE